ncbi:MAG: insulinase family protein [Burkholderiales bacterium]|nr:insulinase family protein [Burkholderiales bacterium]
MKNTITRLLLVWLALAASCALAQAPQKVATVEGVTEYRLTNGLRVLTVPDPSVDTVTVHLTYLVGSRHEGYGEKGMAHLLEHLMFKDSLNFTDIKQEFTRRGARWNGTTSYDRTTYFETLPASEDNLAWALGMEADRMVHSKVAKSDLDSEMTVVRNEFELGENSPGRVLHQRMQRLVFWWHNYGNAIIGSRSDIESVPIDRLQAFYRTWYQPDNAVLIIGGRFDAERALATTAKVFGAIPRPVRSLPRLYTTEPTQDGERSVTLRRAGDTQIVSAMYRIPAGSHPDYPAVEVLVHALGNTPSGRLHRALVSKGLASAVWGDETTTYDPGYAEFGARLGTEASLDAARDALLETLEGVAREPVRADEVERAKVGLLKEVDTVESDSRSLVRWLSEFAALGDWRLFYLYRDRLRQVTVEDVQRVATAYLKPADRVLGQFVPTAQPERAEIPPRPDTAALVADYRGREEVAQGEAFDPSPQNIEKRVIRRELANGIRVALLPRKTRGGTVVASLALYWGDEASKMNRATACGLAGGMLMRGTRKHTRAELRDEFDRLNASVSVDADSASIETKRAQLADVLRLVTEVLREPSFPANEFEELKRASLTSAESHRSDPSVIASERLARYLAPYPRGHWLEAKSTDERIAELKAATLDDARRCYGELVGATGADFVAVGDFDPDAVAKLVEELFGGWKSPHPFTRIPARHFERPPLAEEVRTPDKANAILRAGVNLKLRDDHPDFPALVLGRYLLGGSSAARLPERVREKEGLSYSTYAYFNASSLDESARFGVAAIFAPQNKSRVETAIREELERALKDGFPEPEFESARKGLLEARRLARAQDRSLAARLQNYLFIGRTFAWDVDFENRIRALGTPQVRDALRRYLDPAKLAVLKAGDFRPAN